MSSLKSLFFLGVLAAAACGVYVSLNKSQDSAVPPGVFQNDPDKPVPPKIQMPAGAGSSTPLGNAFAGPASQSPAGGLSGVPLPPPMAGPPVTGPPAGNLPAPPAAGQSLFPAPAMMGPGSVATASTATAVALGGAATAPPPVPAPPPLGGDASAVRRSNLDMPSDGMGRYDAPPPPPQNPAAVAQEAGPSGKLDSLMKTVESSMHAGQWAEAHLLLSSVYGDPRVSPEQAQQVTRLLDQMAATVIYSRQHLLEQPYRVQPGDTLERIAERYNVPPQLLAKINGIRDPRNLAPGRELKVIRGPFSAFVDLGKRELTLMVQGRYAGRFTIDVGTDPAALAALAGTYMVRNKGIRGSQNAAGPAPGPAASSGQLWIDLGNQVTIEARNDAPMSRLRAAGPIGLAPQDMEDVFGILSVGSRVLIQR
jgi:hypothetical protein